MHYVSQKFLSRRALLRGAGAAAVALPFLDAMHPAFGQERLTAAAPVRRLGVCYFPHGATDRWLPTGEGANFTLAEGLAPLERHKQKLLVVGGLCSSVDHAKPDFHLFGSTLSNPTVHSQRNLPVVLAGGSNGRLATGRMITASGVDTPIANMHLTILDKLGIPTEKLGNSTVDLKLDRLST